MHSGKDDFAVAIVREPTNLFQDVIERSAGNVRTDIRNDAVAAAQEAAILDIDIGKVAIGEPRNTGRDVDDAKAAQKIGDFSFVGDDFDDVRQYCQLLGS